MNNAIAPAASAAASPSSLVHPNLHPDERAAREELAACYRVFAMLGWTEMIYNHITVRLPDSVTGGEKQFLINPFGLHYSEVTASNLVKIDLQGKVLDGSPHPVNPAGFTVHAAIHDGLPGRALRDAHAHHGRRGRGLPAGRPGADQLLHRAAARHGGVPRLRGHHHPRRRGRRACSRASATATR